MSKSSEPLPFALALWIKREQEKEEKHKAAMVLKYEQDDKYFIGLLQQMIKEQLPLKQRAFILSLARHKKAGHLFSPAQKSAIANMFFKKEKEVKAS